MVRYVFCFSPDETLTATSDGSGWYELAFGTGGATALLPYRHVLSASLGVDQPLLCHGWCGEDDGFLICGEDPEDAGVSRNAAFSMDENVLEAYFLPFWERRFEPERNAREGWEAKGFDFYGRNDYGRSAVQAMLSDARGRTLLIEPGLGYREEEGPYALITNYSLLAPDSTRPFVVPGDTRYERAAQLLSACDRSFSVSDAFSVLQAVRQEEPWATRVSFVYSQNQHTVYYAENGDFAHIKTHRFFSPVTERSFL